MFDCKNRIVSSIEEKLIHHINKQDFDIVMNTIIKVLNDYDITDRCTDIAVIDPENIKLIKRYCACLAVDGKSKNTISQYRRSIIRFSDFCNKSFRDVGTYDIRYYLGCLKENGLANTSLENQRSNISAFFQWLTFEGIISVNPSLRIKPIKGYQELKEPFSEIEIDSIRSACRTKKDRALVEVLLSTGVRVSELSLMNVDDINFNNLSVFVRHGKGNKQRITYMTPVAAMHLQRYLNSRKEKGNCLFYNKNHKRLNVGGIQYILKAISECACVDHVHPHRFRRTFATNLAKRGMEVQEIQKLLGHTNINTTMKYIYVDNISIQIAYKKCSV